MEMNLCMWIFIGNTQRKNEQNKKAATRLYSLCIHSTALCTTYSRGMCFRINNHNNNDIFTAPCSASTSNTQHIQSIGAFYVELDCAVCVCAVCKRRMAYQYRRRGVYSE